MNKIITIQSNSSGANIMNQEQLCPGFESPCVNMQHLSWEQVFPQSSQYPGKEDHAKRPNVINQISTETETLYDTPLSLLSTVGTIVAMIGALSSFLAFLSTGGVIAGLCLVGFVCLGAGLSLGVLTPGVCAETIGTGCVYSTEQRHLDINSRHSVGNRYCSNSSSPKTEDMSIAIPCTQDKSTQTEETELLSRNKGPEDGVNGDNDLRWDDYSDFASDVNREDGSISCEDNESICSIEDNESICSIEDNESIGSIEDNASMCSSGDEHSISKDNLMGSVAPPISVYYTICF